ncbi:GNAT family N-acetyltransferase [Bacillus sp. RAR_GA_16]|uniref:GNAT family N-acetyltransferase n=1 Tax=Bacillus sp. RAR_GA_16 TaxID=2876774 RepID=UPI001CCF9DC0|nr:GNAT family N-acetyltransferase [Bacillus sp. RAR_GA_16]MCA0171881.1 acetyltransferase [Bacillus sp. RAR_GA_16]
MAFECSITEESGRTISFRPVNEDDVPILHKWMHQKHIYPFWKLNLPLEEIKVWVKNSISSRHKRVFMGYLNKEPVCYVIGYDVRQDPIRHFYSIEPRDMGMHLLIGPRRLLNKEDGETIIRAMTLFLFEKFGANRIIGEPDGRNRIVIPILKKLGANVVKDIQINEKRAKLVIANRNDFHQNISDSNITSSFHLLNSPDHEWEVFNEAVKHGAS